jgi:hypothetical protein
MRALAHRPFLRACLKAAAFTLVGWTIAALVYGNAAPEEADPLVQYEASKSYVVTMQWMGGSSQMIWNEVMDAIASCFRGQNLGITIFAVTTACAFIYLFREAGRESKSS